MKKLLILAAALVLLAPAGASAEQHGHGRIFIGGGFGWYGPGWGSYWGPGWGPYWGAGWWGPGYYDPYPNTGEVKIDSKVNDAQVFINGAYLGTVHDNKTIHLRPGGYKIEIREPGREPYASSVYVTLGKTLHLHPDLQ